MDRQKFEQSCAIKFCVKLGEFATVTYEKLQRAYGEGRNDYSSARICSSIDSTESISPKIGATTEQFLLKAIPDDFQTHS
jgi:hypothetical protein